MAHKVGWRKRNAYRLWWRNLKQRESTWKTRRRCKGNIKMDLAANFLIHKEMRTLLHGIGQLVTT